MRDQLALRPEPPMYSSADLNFLAVYDLNKAGRAAHVPLRNRAIYSLVRKARCKLRFVLRLAEKEENLAGTCSHASAFVSCKHQAIRTRAKEDLG
jgi:hypothetical protein